jgi:hypothetical protein
LRDGGFDARLDALDSLLERLKAGQALALQPARTSLVVAASPRQAYARAQGRAAEV